MTKEEILERVKFHAETRGLSQCTVAEYLTKAKMFQDHYDKPATELNVTHVQDFLHYLIHEKKLAPDSINTYNTGLRFLYNVVLDTPLNLCKIKTVYVHAPVKDDGERTQDIDISYDLIGILPYSLLMNLQNGETA